MSMKYSDLNSKSQSIIDAAVFLTILDEREAGVSLKNDLPIQRLETYIDNLRELYTTDFLSGNPQHHDWGQQTANLIRRVNFVQAVRESGCAPNMDDVLGLLSNLPYPAIRSRS